MLDDSDIAFANQLEREIRKALYGDEKLSGLYRAILASQTWDQFVTTREKIIAYEAVLAEMRKISRRMNGEPEPEPTVAHPHPERTFN